MPTDLLMPKLGLTMEEGKVVRWLAAAGDRVEKGQPVLEIETDKVVVEVEATATGVIGELLAAEGQTVRVNAPLARIYAAGEKAEPAPSAPRLTPVARRMAEKEGVDLSAVAAGGAGRRIRAEDVQAVLSAPVAPKKRRSDRRVFSSPRARKRAKELGLDWWNLSGSGPRGRVVEKDVLRAAPLKGGGDEVIWETPTTPQRVTAERMAASFGSAPHFYLSVEVQAGALLDLKTRLAQRVEQRTGAHLTVTDLLVRIVAAALAEHPQANAFWDEGRIGLHRQVNVGVAVATEAGLVVPVLRQTDRMSLSQIAAERERLVEKARSRSLTPDDLAGGTFTLTNLGMFRVDTFQAILNPPQSAILAVGRIAERPIVVDGQLVARPTVMLSLSCDHRVLDGVLAAGFLGRVAELIEEPYALLV